MHYSPPLTSQTTTTSTAYQETTEVHALSSQDDHSLSPSHNIWIVKPSGLSGGRGITVASHFATLLSAASALKTLAVVQKYIEYPLLIHRRKFDCRVWVVLSHLNPLTLWWYDLKRWILGLLSLSWM